MQHEDPRSDVAGRVLLNLGLAGGLLLLLFVHFAVRTVQLLELRGREHCLAKTVFEPEQPVIELLDFQMAGFAMLLPPEAHGRPGRQHHEYRHHDGYRLSEKLQVPVKMVQSSKGLEVVKRRTLLDPTRNEHPLRRHCIA